MILPKHLNFSGNIRRTVPRVVVCSFNSKILKLYEKVFQQRPLLSHVHKNAPGIIIKASVEAILVTLLVTLKMLLSVEIKFWKAVSRTTFKNLRSFQGKYLWSSPVLVNLLPLRFTVIFPMIFLKLWFYETLLYEP